MFLPISNTMPASKSHKKRAWHYLPCSGLLVITQGREADSYQIEEQPCEQAGQRVFILAHKTRPELYEVVVAAGRATCSGQHCGKHKSCKHRDAVQGVIESGELDTLHADERSDTADEDARVQELDAYFESRQEFKELAQTKYAKPTFEVDFF